MKNSSKNIDPAVLIWLFIVIVIFVWIFIISPFCTKHHEEWEEKRFEDFKNWENRLMAGGDDIHWNN